MSRIPSASSAHTYISSNASEMVKVIRRCGVFTFILINSYVRPVPIRRIAAIIKSLTLQFTSPLNCIPRRGSRSSNADIHTTRKIFLVSILNQTQHEKKKFRRVMSDSISHCGWRICKKTLFIDASTQASNTAAVSLP